MKGRFYAIFIFLASLLLTSCSYISNETPSGCLTESWTGNIQRDPNQWSEYYTTETWDVKNESGQVTEYQDTTLPPEAFQTVLLPDSYFSNLHIEGNFQIQIVGKQKHNSVSIASNNNATAMKEVAIRVVDDTLFIQSAQAYPHSRSPIVIRIGMNQLHNLDNKGTGDIKGKSISSNDLSIISSTRSNIFLRGNMGVMNVYETGPGTITLVGAQTPFLDIKIAGSGTVNVSGNVGVHSITNYGGNVNIIGAESNDLVISASGNGMTGILGNVNLTSLTALDYSRVYVDRVNSRHLNVVLKDRARVGLKGRVWNLNIETSESAVFEGASLQSPSLFVKTRNYSRANVHPTETLFAGAMNSSHIYVFNYAKNLTSISKYPMGDGIIVFVGEGMPCVGDEPYFVSGRGFKGE